MHGDNRLRVSRQWDLGGPVALQAATFARDEAKGDEAQWQTHLTVGSGVAGLWNCICEVEQL